MIMKQYLFILFTFILSLPSVAEVTYPERLSRLEEMAKTVPGDWSQNGNSLGLLGGLFIQTKWQYLSGRDRIPSWEHVNSYLTIWSYDFFQSYLLVDDHACSLHPDKLELCKSWLKYFQAADIRKDMEKKRKISALLWKAHMSSIYLALSDKPDILNDPKVPFKERIFLKGWIKFVQAMARFNLSTDELYAKLLSSKTLPDCSPLGSINCKIQDLPLLKRIFIKRVIRLGQSGGIREQIIARSILSDLRFSEELE